MTLDKRIEKYLRDFPPNLDTARLLAESATALKAAREALLEGRWALHSVADELEILREDLRSPSTLWRESAHKLDAALKMLESTP